MQRDEQLLRKHIIQTRMMNIKLVGTQRGHIGGVSTIKACSKILLVRWRAKVAVLVVLLLLIGHEWSQEASLSRRGSDVAMRWAC